MKTKCMWTALLAVVLSVVISSCNNEKEELVPDNPSGQTDELVVHTEVLSKAPVSTWTDGDHLGLFITKGRLGNNYHDYSGYSNVKSTRVEGAWQQNPNVYLSGEAAVIYAYYPYTTDSYAGNGTTIPLDITTQTDYMYGTHADSRIIINSDNPDVVLNMIHAAGMLQFNMYKKNYTAPGKVTKVVITGTAGTLYKTAYLNCQTGQLTMREEAGTTGIFIENNSEGLLPSLSTSPTDIDAYYPKLLVLPATGRMTGDLTATFTIDDKEYAYKFPSGTSWESAKRYTYTICLNGTQVEIGGSGEDTILIDDWTSGGSGSVDLQ